MSKELIERIVVQNYCKHIFNINKMKLLNTLKYPINMTQFL